MSLSDTDIDGRLGQRIRDLRTAKGLTIEGLAGSAAVSRAMLSRIERGESSPTAQLLAKICGGLGIPLSVLFAATEQPPSPLSRRAAQPAWRDPETRYLRRNVSPPGTGSPVDIVEVEVPAGGSITLDALRLPGADQHIWVLEGVLHLDLGREAFRLETGDCLMMGFDHPIRFRNLTPQPIRYAVIISHGARMP